MKTALKIFTGIITVIGGIMTTCVIIDLIAYGPKRCWNAFKAGLNVGHYYFG